MRGTVLVTGAGGFIGSAVVRRLVHTLRRRPVSCGARSPVARIVAGLRPGGSHRRLAELEPGPEWSIVEADVASPDELRSTLDELRPLAVIHCACTGVFRLELSLDQARQTNVSPLEVLFEGLARVRGSRLIHAGSAFVLEAGRSLNESARTAPRTNYARSKAEADRRIEELAIGSPVDWFNLRLFHTYGAYEAPERLFPYLVTSLTRGRETQLSSGEQIRDFNNVESIAGAFLLALEADGESAGGLYHIGSGDGRSVREFALSVAEIVGHPDRLRFDSRELHPGEVAAWVSDPSRAREDLGWEPPDGQRELREATRWWADRLKVAS